MCVWHVLFALIDWGENEMKEKKKFNFVLTNAIPRTLRNPLPEKVKYSRREKEKLLRGPK